MGGQSWGPIGTCRLPGWIRGEPGDHESLIQVERELQQLDQQSGGRAEVSSGKSGFKAGRYRVSWQAGTRRGFAVSCLLESLWYLYEFKQ